MKTIKRLNQKTKCNKGVSDVCDIMNDFLSANLQSTHRFQFEKIGDNVIALNGFHNNLLTAPIHALAYIVDTEIDTNILYTGITGDGITFNRMCGKDWSDVYNALHETL